MRMRNKEDHRVTKPTGKGKGVTIVDIHVLTITGTLIYRIMIIIIIIPMIRLNITHIIIIDFLYIPLLQRLSSMMITISIIFTVNIHHHNNHLLPLSFIIMLPLLTTWLTPSQRYLQLWILNQM